MNYKSIQCNQPATRSHTMNSTETTARRTKNEEEKKMMANAVKKIDIHCCCKLSATQHGLNQNEKKNFSFLLILLLKSILL